MIEKDLYSSMVKSVAALLLVIVSAILLWVIEFYVWFGALMMLYMVVDQCITSFITVRECVKELKDRESL